MNERAILNIVEDISRDFGDDDAFVMFAYREGFGPASCIRGDGAGIALAILIDQYAQLSECSFDEAIEHIRELRLHEELDIMIEALRPSMSREGWRNANDA